MNFPILRLQELHRSRVFPDVDHPSKALSNVFTEKRQDGIFAGLHMPAGRFVLAITSGREHRRFPGQWPGQSRTAREALDFVGPLVAAALDVPWAAHAIVMPILADLQESAVARADDQATARGLRPRRRFALVDPLPDVLRSPDDPPLPDDRVVLRPTARPGRPSGRC